MAHDCDFCKNKAEYKGVDDSGMETYVCEWHHLKMAHGEEIRQDRPLPTTWDGGDGLTFNIF